MANPKKLIASAAVAAGLLGGGVAGLVLGVPGVSGAQTTTVPDAPTTTAPDAPDAPDTPRRDRENCPEKDGSDATEGSGTNLNLRRGAGRV